MDAGTLGLGLVVEMQNATPAAVRAASTWCIQQASCHCRGQTTAGCEKRHQIAPQGPSAYRAVLPAKFMRSMGDIHTPTSSVWPALRSNLMGVDLSVTPTLA